MVHVMDETMKFNLEKTTPEPRVVIEEVYNALREKGYNPINQMVGYIMSGDPSYITSYNNARSVIRKLERDEILEVLLRAYLEGEG
jgi:uncharacterized protein (UPF0297 family)